MKHIKKLGINGKYFRTNGFYENQTIYGAYVAGNELLKGVFQYSTVEQVRMSCIKGLHQNAYIQRMYRRAYAENKNIPLLNVEDKIELLQKNKKFECDIIHDFTEGLFDSLFFRERLTYGSPPVSCTLHTAGNAKLISHSFFMSMFLGMQNYDSLVCSSISLKRVMEKRIRFMQEALEKLYNIKFENKCRLDIVPLGIEEDSIVKMERKEARRKTGIADEDFVILFLGRISAISKADMFPLIKVFKRLISCNPGKKLILLIAGLEEIGYRYFYHIKKYCHSLGIADRVIIKDKVSYKERGELYSAADIFTSPVDSIQETFGLTPIEAMSFGIPQVVSDWDGYRETVWHGKTGFCVPTYWTECDEDISQYIPGDSDEMGLDFYNNFLLNQSVAVNLDKYQYYIQQLIDYPELRIQMGENSIKLFKEKYTMHTVIKNYESLWEELLSIYHVEGAIEKKHKALDVFDNKYSIVFEHYPTTMLKPSQLFGITNDGIEYVNGNAIHPYHYDTEDFFNEMKIVDDILGVLYKYGDMSIEKIESHMEGILNKSVIKRSIMYSLKHGFTKLV